MGKCKNCGHELIKSVFTSEGIIHKKERPKYIGGISVCYKRVRLGKLCGCGNPEPIACD